MTPPTTIAVTRATRAPSAPTRRVCEACARLGITAPDLLTPPAPDPRAFTINLAPATITLITGASGTGKSTLLRDITRAARTEHITILGQSKRPLPNRPAIDLAATDTQSAMRALASAGLAEAACFARRPSQLSEGQRWRLRLALDLARALRRASPAQPVALVIDEFASTLDPRTASSIAHLLRAAADRHRTIALILASPRTDIAAPLAPDTHIQTHHANRLTIETTPHERSRPRFIIEPGSIADYDALAHLHYRAGQPATIARILAARDAVRGSLAGVLITSMPTLNASWRQLAWPNRYTTPSRRDNALRVNEEIRCISRVIVDPARRSMGVARRLVAAYLADPDTPATEALAAMGHACPFFARAGMTPYTLAPTARDARLLDALEHAHIEPWRLALPSQALRRATEHTSLAFIDRETRLWANASGATRRHARDELPPLFARACAAVAARPVAYAHTA
ncbi:MAG: AAA family ATPase [Phycisphaerales bacterium]|nr:AAA family ATPase [Phycisphaerales bacterium]